MKVWIKKRDNLNLDCPSVCKAYRLKSLGESVRLRPSDEDCGSDLLHIVSLERDTLNGFRYVHCILKTLTHHVLVLIRMAVLRLRGGSCHRFEHQLSGDLLAVLRGFFAQHEF